VCLTDVSKINNAGIYGWFYGLIYLGAAGIYRSATFSNQGAC